MGEFACIGPFEISGLIGTGGTSVVFRGEHEADGTSSAVKVLTGKFARRDEFRRAVYREIRATSKLHHPGIVNVLDFGEISSDTHRASDGRIEEGSPWYAMELVEGDSLSEATMAWSWWLFRDVLLDLLDALAHAHAPDVVHRDLKPGNVLVAGGSYGRSRIKLIDFGIARSFDVREPEGDEEVFADAEIFGTPKYMAPEQILGRWRDQGPWTDLYSVGALAWRLACERPPYDAEETQQILRAHIHAHLPPFDATLPLPEGFEAWVRRLLEEDPRERYRRAADAASALLALGDPEGDRASERRPAAEGSAPSGTSRMTLGVLEDSTESDFGEAVDAAPSIPGLGVAGPDGRASADEAPRPAPPETTLPPFPEEWRRQGEYDERRSLAGAGLNLLGLRTVPIVDREELRSRLWSSLEAVCRQGTPRGVVLRGPSGFGKTRLATWLKYRAHEVGAAEVLTASHGRVMGESDGLGPMFARHFRCASMSDAEAYFRVRDIYENFGFPETTARYDAMGLVSMMKLESDFGFDATGFRTPRERQLALVRLLTRLAGARPIVVVLDDAQWGPQSMELAKFLFDAGGDFPVFVVATVSKESSSRLLERDADVEGFEARDGVESMHLGQLDLEAQRELFEVLLPFHPGLAAEAARRTRGDPLFAVQLVDDWAEEQLLESSPRGYSLRSGAQEPFPDDIHRLWERRVDRLAESVADEPERVSAAVELAAAIGREFTRREWRHACDRAALEREPHWLDELMRRGMATEYGGHVVLAHETLRRALADRARRRDRWQRFHSVCAEIVGELHSSDDPDVAARRAHHLLEAGSQREAVAALCEAGRRVAQKSESGPLRRLVDRATPILEKLDLPPSAPERVESTWMRGWVQRADGQPVRARASAETALEHAREGNQPENAAWSLVLRGNIERDAGRYAAAFPYYELARENFEAADDELGVAIAVYFEGVTHARRCEWEEGARLQKRAESMFEALGDRVWQSRARTSRSQILIAVDRYDEAKALSEDGMELARRCGNRVVEASVWNQRGEIARFQSDWERARDCYRRSEELYESAGSRARYTIRLNRALVDLETEQFAAAEAIVDELVDVYPEIGYGKHVPIVYLAKMWCAAGRRDWSEWREACDAYRDFVREREFEASEGGYLLERVARAAREAGRDGRAEESLRLAAELYERLGEPEEARRVRERLQATDDR